MNQQGLGPGGWCTACGRKTRNRMINATIMLNPRTWMIPGVCEIPRDAQPERNRGGKTSQSMTWCAIRTKKSNTLPVYLTATDGQVRDQSWSDHYGRLRWWYHSVNVQSKQDNWILGSRWAISATRSSLYVSNWQAAAPIGPDFRYVFQCASWLNVCR